MNEEVRVQKNMKKIQILLSVLIILFLSACKKNANQTSIKTDVPYLVVVSLDGFRWDYPQQTKTLFFDYLEKIGSKANSLMPVFPSKTFPNHYSIATGLYASKHGIVNNSFYDSTSNSYYSIKNREAVCNGYFYGGEPIWVTAKKQHIKTASFFWVGSEADIQGMRPDIYKRYNSHISYQARIDSVVQWLQKPIEERPHLIMLYFEQPDNFGHKYGTDDSLTLNKVTEMDAYMADLYQKLQKLPIKDSINLIITSDHGMSNVHHSQNLVLSDYLNEHWVDKVVGSNPIYNIKAKDKYIDSVANALSAVPHLLSWKREDLPESFHYQNNNRVLDVVVCADLGWGLLLNDEQQSSKGTHGYPPEYKDMHAIFYGVGPAFKTDYKISTFKNVDIYNVMCYILGLDPAPNDGKFIHVHKMLN